MNSIIKVYITNASQYESETLFKAAMESVSHYRRQKISLLKNNKDKQRSLAAAAALNAALKEYGLEEQAMEYGIGEHGKPYFRNNPEIHFSLSHSGDYAICSIGSCENGNDIERVRSGRERVAKRFFAAEELDWIYAAQDIRQIEERIFRVWTMKESFLKVTGLGMSLPLNEFAVLKTAVPAATVPEAVVLAKDSGIVEDELAIVRQNINDISYKIKEYIMPECFAKDGDYKIAVCSAGGEFTPEVIAVE